MEKTTYKVPEMDCAAEENLVRMKLDPFPSVRALDFDLRRRSVTVYHDGDHSEIGGSIAELGLGSQLIDSSQVDEDDVHQIAQDPSQGPQQRRMLWIVLSINFTFFVIEIATGFISGSMGLVADSLDMLADAIVYGLSLMAVGSTVLRKKKVAGWAGYLQLTLAILGFAEVLRRFLGVEELPDFSTMIIVSISALVANSFSLYLLQRSRSTEAHMRASMIFTSNDIIINLGVITAGVLVSWLDSSVPDLIVGAIVFTVVSRGAFRILKLAS